MLACLSLIVGIAGMHALPVFALALALILVPASVWRRLLATLAIVLGALLSPKIDVAPVVDKRDVALNARVATVPRIFESVQSCEIEAVMGRWILYWDGNPLLSLGDRIKVQGREGPVKPGSEHYWRLRGIHGVVSAEEGGVQIAERGSFVSVWASDWRRAFLDHTASSIEHRSAETVDALCFNVDGRLDPTMRDNLQRSGTTHIVSASGLHTLILALALQFLLAFFPIPRWAQLAILCGLLAMYAFATGLRPPIVRSVVMVGTMAFAYVFRREADLLSALAAAALVYLLVEPDSVFDIGFQLSFLTVGALGLYLQGAPETARSGLKAAIIQGKQVARASTVATLASGPLVAYHFGMFSFISVVANVLIAFVLPPIIVLSMLSLAIRPLSEALATGIMHVFVGPLAGWVLWVADTLGPLPISAVNVPEFSPYWMLLYYAAFLLLWRKRARPA